MPMRVGLRAWVVCCCAWTIQPDVCLPLHMRRPWRWGQLGLCDRVRLFVGVCQNTMQCLDPLLAS
jgi:hypothetical protein